MDGDGSILVYKDYVSIEATTSIDDNGILSEIKNKFGGSIKIRSNANALRWRSRKKDVVLQVLNCLNGQLHNTLRLSQFKTACDFYSIPFIETKECQEMAADAAHNNLKPLCTDAYFSGLFDADGSISISVDWKRVDARSINISGIYGKVQRLIYSRGFHQCQIKCTSKHKINLEHFIKRLQLGDLYFEYHKAHSKWHWVLKSFEFDDFLRYLEINPLKGRKKKNRFHLLSKYFKLKALGAHLAPHDSAEFKEWQKFCYMWYNYQKDLSSEEQNISNENVL